MFGFLEIEEDPEALRGLLDAAAAWLRQRGRDRMVGPMDFTMNDECGVLIDGFEREPLLRQSWHPPYYRRLCEEVGLEKAVDLFMWSLHISGRDKVMPIIWELADQLEPKHGIRIRKMSRRGLRRDLDAFAEIYNEAWSRNWGFVPYYEGGPRRLRPGAAAGLRPQLVHGGRGQRRPRRWAWPSPCRTSTRCSSG